MNAQTRTELEAILAQDQAELDRLNLECNQLELKVAEVEAPYKAVRAQWAEVYHRVEALQKILKRMEQQ